MQDNLEMMPSLSEIGAFGSVSLRREDDDAFVTMTVTLLTTSTLGDTPTLVVSESSTTTTTSATPTTPTAISISSSTTTALTTYTTPPLPLMLSIPTLTPTTLTSTTSTSSPSPTSSPVGSIYFHGTDYPVDWTGLYVFVLLVPVFFIACAAYSTWSDKRDAAARAERNRKLKELHAPRWAMYAAKVKSMAERERLESMREMDDALHQRQRARMRMEAEGAKMRMEAEEARGGDKTEKKGPFAGLSAVQISTSPWFKNSTKEEHRGGGLQEEESRIRRRRPSVESFETTPSAHALAMVPLTGRARSLTGDMTASPSRERRQYEFAVSSEDEDDEARDDVTTITTTTGGRVSPKKPLKPGEWV